MPKTLYRKYLDLVDLQIDKLSLQEQINYLTKNFKNISISTSFSYEDQIITYLFKDEQIRIFTLDTGRLFEETYETWNRTVLKYKIKIEAFYPNANEIRDFVTKNGPDSFYTSIENRKKCCEIRKVSPLKLALQNEEVWITGLREEHSITRKGLNLFEWDETNKIIKFHPLLFWRTNEVEQFILDKDIPYNQLHKKGFVSIGCAPCTKAITENEDLRAGRWWWENPLQKECGLHTKSIK